MAINRNEQLQRARREGNDEFYTRIEDIERELEHYEDKFKNKVILCNCDDPTWSNFWKYFELNFDRLNLKGLISTHYEPTTLFENERSYKVEITRTPTGKMSKAKKTYLNGDGDFRSDECIALLKEADIVVTNPPFSLFRAYVAQLVQFKKKFLIVGHQNAVTYKEIFPLIKDGKLWLGYGFKGGAAHFINKHYDDYAAAGDHKAGMIRVSGVHWFTNLPNAKRNEELILVNRYRKADYPKYDNFDAIEVSKTRDIPMDYKGLMGVPITFLDKYNPNQFEILGVMASTTITETNFGYPYVNGNKIYARIVIRNKQI